MSIGDMWSDFWGALTGAINVIVDSIRKSFELWNWALGITIGLLVYTVTYAVESVGLIFGYVSALLGGRGQFAVDDPVLGALSQGFEIANAVLPLTEAFALVIALATFWLIAATIRVIKSFVPTIN